jgi:hypothetical protein
MTNHPKIKPRIAPRVAATAGFLIIKESTWSIEVIACPFVTKRVYSIRTCAVREKIPKIREAAVTHPLTFGLLPFNCVTPVYIIIY